MKVNHKKYALFAYENGPEELVSKNPFQLGDVVIHNDTKEIGVVIQIHDAFEVRTDMFGNECISNLSHPSFKELTTIKHPRLLIDLYDNTSEERFTHEEGLKIFRRSIALKILKVASLPWENVIIMSQDERLMKMNPQELSGSDAEILLPFITEFMDNETMLKRKSNGCED